MSDQPENRLAIARPSEVKILGRSMVDQLLKLEEQLRGPEQFLAKKKIIAHFEKHEPDLFPFFQKKVISPYQLLVRVQKAFETQSDVRFDGNVISKSNAVTALKRYIPNLQYLHDNQLYTNADTFKELGAAVAIGVVTTGITEAVGREFVQNPFLSMEMALTQTLCIALIAFLYFLLRRNRSVFHKAPWNSAIYLGANLHEANPENWEKVIWKTMQCPFKPTEGFTLIKSRPHYESLDKHYVREKGGKRGQVNCRAGEISPE